jgi:heme/copper-type cytochrome/quinol oxidase subunit 2
MTTRSTTIPPETPTRSITGVAVLTAIVTTLALLWANFVDTPWRDPATAWGINSDRGIVGLLLIAGFVALGVGVVYGVVVRRAMATDPAREARTAVILALVGVLTIVAFWTGLPIVLGSAAAHLGLDARARLGHTPPTAGIAISLGLLVATAALFICVTG